MDQNTGLLKPVYQVNWLVLNAESHSLPHRVEITSLDFSIPIKYLLFIFGGGILDSIFLCFVLMHSFLCLDSLDVFSNSSPIQFAIYVCPDHWIKFILQYYYCSFSAHVTLGEIVQALAIQSAMTCPGIWVFMPFVHLKNLPCGL